MNFTIGHLILVIVGAGIITAIVTKFNRLSGSITALLLSIGIAFVCFYPAFHILPISFTTGDYTFIFNLSTLSRFFLMLFSGMFPLVIMATVSTKPKAHYYFFFYLILASVIGTISSQDLLSFFFFFELMTLFSYLLVIYKKRAIKAGLVYILMGIIGGLSLLLGIFYVFWLSKDFRISVEILKGSYATLFLLSLPFLIKMAAMPVHIWAPDTYKESEDVYTAFLSGVLSKLGIYGLIFFWFTWGIYGLSAWGKVFDVPVTGYIIAWIGAITAFIGAVYALLSEDVKKLLAYSSISQLGYILVGFGIMSSLGWAGALYHTLTHTIFKTMLFIVVAGIIFRLNTTKLSEMGGLIKKMPVSFLTLLVGIIALAGVPPTMGFASKYLIYSALFEKKLFLLTAVVFAASTAAFLYAYRLIHNIFLGPLKTSLKNTKEAPLPFLIPSLILSLFLVMFGFFPGVPLEWINNILMSLGMKSIASTFTTISTSLGGFNGLLSSSIFISIFGIIFILYLILFPKAKWVNDKNTFTAGEVMHNTDLLTYSSHFYRFLEREFGLLIKLSVKKLYDNILGIFEWMFDVARKLLYHGNVNGYVWAIILVTLTFVISFLIGGLR